MMGQSLVRRDLAVRYAVICFVTHSIFITLGLIPGWRMAPLLAGDAATYVKPAQNIVSNRAFSREDVPPFLWEPYRTPAYPLAIAASIRLLGSYQWALYLAAVTAGLAGFCAVRFAGKWGANLRTQHIAGIIAALLPNSLGLSGMLLTDAATGHLMLVWIYLLYLVCARSSILAVFGSAAVLWCLQSLKPTFNIALLLILLVGVLYARSKRSWMMVVLLVLLTLPVPGYFAWRNLKDHGVFTPSLLGVVAVREYLQPRQSAAETGLDFATIVERNRRVDKKAAEALQTPPSFYGRLYLVQSRETNEFFSTHPATALRLMFTEMAQQFIAPQEFAFQVFWPALPLWMRALGSLLTLGLWVSAAWGSWNLGRAGDWRPGLLVLGILLFFLLTGSISHYVGARLRFPADMVAIPLAAVGLGRFARRKRIQSL